jgi:hypothetical protein
MDLFTALANDPSVAPAFRRIFADPKPDVRTVAFDKAAPRRFTGEPMTGFGGIDEVGSDRWREVRDDERADHQRDERRERIARGE